MLLRLVLVAVTLSTTARGHLDVAERCRVGFKVIGTILLPSNKVRSDLRPSLQTLLDSGPDRWIALPTHPTGDHTFIRGLSGGNAFDPKAGTPEAMNLLAGNLSILSRNVWPDPDPEIAQGTPPSGFGNPLTIWGRAASLKSNQASQKYHVGDLEARVGVFSIEDVEKMGLFLPRHKDPGGQYVRWARSFVAFCDTLSKQGLAPTAGSRGADFLQKMREVVARHRGRKEEVRVVQEDVWQLIEKFR